MENQESIFCIVEMQPTFNEVKGMNNLQHS